MLRKIAMTLAAFAPLAMSATAVADHGWWEDDDDDSSSEYRTVNNHSSRYDAGFVYADVIDVEPVYRYVRVRVPEQECWNERVRDRQHRRHNDTVASTVTGGVIGGAIGRQFGDGDGRDALTVLGALIGSAMAHESASHRNQDDYYYDRPRVRTVERCTTRYTSREERRIDGYHVTYVYGGRRYMTQTPRDPGDRIRVRVAVTPVSNGRY